MFVTPVSPNRVMHIVAAILQHSDKIPEITHSARQHVNIQMELCTNVRTTCVPGSRLLFRRPRLLYIKYRPTHVPYVLHTETKLARKCATIHSTVYVY